MSLFYAVVAAAVAMMFADWLFSGVIAHKQYNVYPEVWRSSPGGETGKIVASNLLNILSAFVFCLLCSHLHLHRFMVTGHVALAIWLIGPLPLLMANGLWIKLTPAVTAAHAAGWLVKLMLAAAAVALLLP